MVSIPDAVSILPEGPDEKELWFENLRYFEQGDLVEGRMGAPCVT